LSFDLEVQVAKVYIPPSLQGCFLIPFEKQKNELFMEIDQVFKNSQGLLQAGGEKRGRESKSSTRK
jgi:hypothetical protein